MSSSARRCASLTRFRENPETVNSLRERTIATNSIPTGWTHILGKNDKFVLCYVDSWTGTHTVSICLTVLEALTWTVSIYDKEAQIPNSYKWAQKLNSVTSLTGLLGSLVAAPRCQGNNDKAFVDLCRMRGGTFSNKSGMHIIVLAAV